MRSVEKIQLPPQPCKRCSTPIHTEHRFCSGCGLPASGEAPLSTEIRELRTAEDGPERGSGDRLGRVLSRVGALLMVLFVAAVGIVLFHRPFLDQLMPADVRDAAPSLTSVRKRIEPEWVTLPPATFLYGPGEHPLVVDYDLRISRFEISNKLWWQFLRSEEEALRASNRLSRAYPSTIGGWPKLDLDAPLEPPPREILDQPVRHVSALAAEDFCAWLTRRLDQPDWIIRLPTDVEWEYAARGVENRRWPWGSEFGVIVPHVGMSRVRRRGLADGRGPSPVEFLPEDVTPQGVMGMGTNVSEWAIREQRRVGDYNAFVAERERLEREFGPYCDQLADQDRFLLSSVVRGAAYSHDDMAEEFATTWKNRDVNERMRHAAYGFRVVKVRRPVFDESGPEDTSSADSDD